MRVLLKTNDAVLLSFAQAVLAGEGIETVVLDGNISVLEGSIGVFPRRLAVGESEWERAARALGEAGLGNWITGEGDT